MPPNREETTYRCVITRTLDGHITFESEQGSLGGLANINLVCAADGWRLSTTHSPAILQAASTFLDSLSPKLPDVPFSSEPNPYL